MIAALFGMAPRSRADARYLNKWPLLGSGVTQRNVRYCGASGGVNIDMNPRNSGCHAISRFRSDRLVVSLAPPRHAEAKRWIDELSARG